MKVLFSYVFITAIIFSINCSSERPHFAEKILDDQAPSSLWMKSVGDVNMDGKTDILAGGWQDGGMVAYLAPDWRKTIINDSLKISTDAEVCDVNKDKINDIVAVVNGAIIWFEGPAWRIHVIDSITGHDVEVFDFDNDGVIDVISRNQGAFGTLGGHTLYFYNQKPLGAWTKYSKEISDGEGIKMADINEDGKMDVVTNGYWFENTGNMAVWNGHKFTETWEWVNAAIDVADINNDGLPDILHSPSELKGNYYRISWFEAPEDPTSLWKEHIVADSVETVFHSMGAADFDSDGKIDIIVAEMEQGIDPDEVTIYFNLGKNKWEKRVISTGGSHSMRIMDIDNDGDPDLFGANWNDNVIKIWLNGEK